MYVKGLFADQMLLSSITSIFSMTVSPMRLPLYSYNSLHQPISSQFVVIFCIFLSMTNQVSFSDGQIASMFFKEVASRMVSSFTERSRLIYGPEVRVLENSYGERAYK